MGELEVRTVAAQHLDQGSNPRSSALERAGGEAPEQARKARGGHVVVDAEEYYRKYGPMVLRRCWRLLHDEKMAVDAMHEVFANLFRSRDRMVPERPASLLLRVSTSVCLNVVRAERRPPEDSGDERLRAIACAEEQEERSMTRFTLGSRVGGEAESTRVMAVMHFVDGLNLKEVGDEVGLSATGVHRRLRGLKMRLDRPSDSGSTKTGGRTIKARG